MKWWLITLTFLMVASGLGQTDSVNKKRLAWSLGTTGTVLGGSIIGLGTVWYKDVPKSNFHVFNDSKNWLYMDKLGHAYAANQLANTQATIYRWSGWNRKKAAWVGAGIAWTYQFSFEMLDAYSSEWGFSWSDIGANTAGAGLFLGQELLWKEQKIQLKFGYKPSPYASLRPSVLGSNFQERLLKDYNAQSYWLSASPHDFGWKTFPSWLQLSVGYSADAKLKGSEDVYSINGVTYTAHRELGLSLDVNWNKLPIQRKWLKNSVRVLNVIKLPTPAVFWRNGICYVGIM